MSKKHSKKHAVKSSPKKGGSREFEHTEEALKKRAAKFAYTKGVPESDITGSARDFSYTQNREISWLLFDNRVLDEAFDENVPLFERLKFASIFGSNLDEWFMIRIGGLSDLALLKHQPRDNKSNQTPAEQLKEILGMLPRLIDRQEQAFDEIESRLAEHGVVRVSGDSLTDSDRTAIRKMFRSTVAPIISPMIVDPRHPFPNLKNGNLYIACTLDGPDEQGLLGIVEVPATLKRVFILPSSEGELRYMLLEDAILQMLATCFGEYAPTSSAVLRVTRNADVDPDGEGVEEEEDYRQHMKKVLKRRQRLQPVRLEVEGYLPEEQLGIIEDRLGLAPYRVFKTSMPLDLDAYVYGLEGLIPEQQRPELLFEPFEPQLSPMVTGGLPMREQVEDHDILLTYPYESMTPLLTLLREASSDENCISIKITLYRVAKQSKLCESLIAAVENGKEVTVLMELRARFDEANNIAWADRLEHAGCTVIYGQEGFKCHSKICQITYHDDSGIRRITCLGTGNFNEKTARLYSDFMLLTAHPGIGEDGNTFFRNLSLGNLKGNYDYLGVAPSGLKPLVMRGLNREIGRARAGEAAQVFMKMNSLTDRDVIDKISEACQAGVHVMLMIRGICCIKANIPGRTDGLIVHQIVGRFLEHARIYAFGADADTVYLSSADMMTRNTERRVEICYPVLDPTCKKQVVEFANLQLADDVKARSLTPEGTWERISTPEGTPRIDAQKLLFARAYIRAEGGGDTDETSMARLFPALSPIEAATLMALPEIGLYEVEGSDEKRQRIVSPREFFAEEARITGQSQADEAEAEDVAGQDEDAPVAEPAPEVAEPEADLVPEPAVTGAEEPEASSQEAPQAAPVAREKGEVATPVVATPAQEEPVVAVQPEPEPEPEPKPELDEEPEPAPEAEPEPVSEPEPRPAPVEAHVLEPEEPETAPREPQAATPGAGARTSTTSIEIRRPNRLGVAFTLIGLGLKELFTGSITKRRR